MIYTSSPCSLGIMAQSVDFARILMLSLDNLRVCRACPKLDNNCSAKKTVKFQIGAQRNFRYVSVRETDESI